MKTLHILNGDATLHGFQHSGLDGDTLIWREVLSEGPLTEDIGSAAFWQARAEWIAKGMNTTTDDYYHKMTDQLGKLNEPYEQICLWFEFDLHCQLNMLGAMVLLEKHVDLSEPVISLVCPDSYPGFEDFRGMGELNGDQLAGLYDSRHQLSPYDFDLAAEAWQLYASGDAPALQKWIDETPFWGALHLLKPALEAHLKRLSVNADSLNYIEQELVNAYHAGAKTRHELYAAFWKNNAIYGMGDAEINLYINKLQEGDLIKTTG